MVRLLLKLRAGINNQLHGIVGFREIIQSLHKRILNSAITGTQANRTRAVTSGININFHELNYSRNARSRKGLIVVFGILNEYAIIFLHGFIRIKGNN
jgi:hypothetical protein